MGEVEDRRSATACIGKGLAGKTARYQRISTPPRSGLRLNKSMKHRAAQS